MLGARMDLLDWPCILASSTMWHGSWPDGSIWIQLVTRWFHPRLRAEQRTAEDGLPFQDSGSSGGRPERSGSQGQRVAGLV